jgi:hypothetical protein
MNYTLQHLSDAPNVPAALDGKILFTSEKLEWRNTGTSPLKLIVMKILK